jgi:CRP/FNR family transcriptional regulator, cyclic AMP receptor protein
MDLIAHFREARSVVSVPSGLVLFREGEPGTNMYVLMEGEAVVCVGDEVVEVAKAGALLGEMAMVNSTVRSATVITRTDCRLVSIEMPQFDMLIRESPEFARHVMTVIADRLRRVNERLKEALGELSVRGRRPR